MTMRAVLGIDAAWTATQPSGVALAARQKKEWVLIAAEPSYEHFFARTEKRPPRDRRPPGSLPSVPALLASCHRLCGCSVELIAIDMPLSRLPIDSRRFSDNAVSIAYGGRRCGTHTPSALRPGPISDDLRKSFDEAGYALRTEAISTPGLIEVFPHPALLELTRAKERLPYKAAKIKRYWPDVTPEERRRRLYRQWSDIVDLLNCEMCGVRDAFPPLGLNASGRELKAFEDRLDAVICAWVAICALKRQAKAFGDRESAIWVPVAARSRRRKRQNAQDHRRECFQDEVCASSPAQFTRKVANIVAVSSANATSAPAKSA